MARGDEVTEQQIEPARLLKTSCNALRSQFVGIKALLWRHIHE